MHSLKDTVISASEGSLFNAIIFMSDITVFKGGGARATNTLPLKKALRGPDLASLGHTHW
jgi:hypothetical protein